jgi:hypothetical protein
MTPPLTKIDRCLITRLGYGIVDGRIAANKESVVLLRRVGVQR